MKRSPYVHDVGYVASRRCLLGGHVVVYDRSKMADGEIDADHRWIVMHRPSSHHVAVPTRIHALWVMWGVAGAKNDDEARFHADILPREE